MSGGMSDGSFPALRNKLAHPTIVDALTRLVEFDRLAAPLVVDLDPTSYCDLGCPGCISASVLRTRRFEERRLLDMAQEMAAVGVKAVVLIGGGEPLMHRA